MPTHTEYYPNGKPKIKTYMTGNCLHRGNDSTGRQLPAYIEYYDNGCVKEKRWYINGMLYRGDSQFCIEMYNNNNILIKESDSPDDNCAILYYDTGEIRRKINNKNIIQPAVIDYYKTGSCMQKTWLLNGRVGRINGYPAVITYYLNGSEQSLIWYDEGTIADSKTHPSVVNLYMNDTNEYSIGNNNLIWDRKKLPLESQYWYKNGMLSCKYRPAVVSYYPDGTTREEIWYIKGVRHNTFEPSILYYEDGNIKCKEWYKNDKLYRVATALPCYVEYSKSGKVIIEKYNNGKIKCY